MRVIIAPNPILRTKCDEVDIDKIKSLKGTARQMAKLMYKSRGCGLAAPQVGLLQRIIVVDCDFESEKQNPVILINPVISKAWGEKVIEGEGCLSIPGITIPIERSTNVVIEAYDLDAQEVAIEAEGFYARCLQHEIDHLDGETMFEHLDPIARIQAFQQFEEALAAGAKPGDTSM